MTQHGCELCGVGYVWHQIGTKHRFPWTIDYALPCGEDWSVSSSTASRRSGSTTHNGIWIIAISFARKKASSPCTSVKWSTLLSSPVECSAMKVNCPNCPSFSGSSLSHWSASTPKTNGSLQSAMKTFTSSTCSWSRIRMFGRSKRKWQKVRWSRFKMILVSSESKTRYESTYPLQRCNDPKRRRFSMPLISREPSAPPRSRYLKNHSAGSISTSAQAIPSANSSSLRFAVKGFPYFLPNFANGFLVAGKTDSIGSWSAEQILAARSKRTDCFPVSMRWICCWLVPKLPFLFKNLIFSFLKG